jgi:hypothetical protein
MARTSYDDTTSELELLRDCLLAHLARGDDLRAVIASIDSRIKARRRANQ